ncbi:MAG TPA: peptidoglycan-binding domain-containing protein [Candidatus Paceibacterota bacterium]|nr:peptidoglycan-binding domain-containing protein [Candidatus Paceibacterota bacterium]
MKNKLTLLTIFLFSFLIISTQAFASTTNGTVTGYAWGENIGWVDFSNVTIDNHGYFTGAAYGENIGWITFDKDNTNIVTTDWRPASTRTHHTSSGSYLPGYGSKANLPVVTPTENPTSTVTPPLLERTLKLKMIGTDVKALQVFLNTHGFSLTQTGFGSTGHETTLFGKLTDKAVKAFQTKNKLKPDGIVGPITRGIINQLNNEKK